MLVALFRQSLAHALLVAAAGLPAGQSAEEYQLKAAFLFHLGEFVTWPQDTADVRSDTFVIGILGPDPVEPYLQALEGERIRGRKLRVRRVDDPGAVGEARILLVSSSQSRSLPRLLEAAAGSGVLTVGETLDFTQEGGVLRWFVEEAKLRLEVNRCAAEEAGLTISARLLRLTRVTVGSCRGGEG